MRKAIAIMFVVMTIAIMLPSPFSTNYITTAEAPNKSIDEYTIIEMINEVAPRFNQDPKLIKGITWCESNHRVVVHDGGYGKGVTGFHKKTFDRYLKMFIEEGGENLNYNSSYDQLKLMSYAFSKGESARREWTTYVAYKNGGTYAFYSRLLKKNFVVNCSF